ncbi:type II toxin-antitoxin system Phd/YefM family antitoxin [Patescibacteria group bacterium AH-259-L05]|nr:type II toxin-antitoxin system Phd/YefM family antitoxin [Patescibacteria group bacterium AH-259-L05]
MNTKTTLSISEARKKIFTIAKKVQKPSTHYTLTEKGKPKVVMMSAEEFESWEETLEVMRDFPDLMKDIKEVERDIKTGAYKKYTPLEDILVEEGYILTNKGGKYELSNKAKTKRRKGSR